MADSTTVAPPPTYDHGNVVTHTVVGKSRSLDTPWADIVGSADQYGPIVVPGIGQSLKETCQHAEWERDRRRYNFYDISYRGGPEYKDGLDALGNPIMWVHDDLRESKEGFERRKRMAVYVNYCKSIVNKFVSFVFRQEIRRDGKDEGFNLWAQDVDLNSTRLNTFMRTTMNRACRFGRYLIGVDSTMPADGSVQTVAQARAAGVKVFLTRIDPRRMINWRRENGVLTEALIVYGAGEMAILWRRHDRVVFLMDDKGKIIDVEEQPHEWGRLPIIEVAPLDGDSLIADIAELNRDHFNFGSLLREELYNNTFTMRVFTGVNADQLKDALFGPNRILAIPNPEAKVVTIGGDPAQAEVLRACVADSKTEIYTQAGLKAEDPLKVGQAKSGVALKVEFNDLAAILSAIAEEAERVESEIVKIYNQANNAEVSAPVYPEEFGSPDTMIELERAFQVLESTKMTPTAQLHESRRINRVLHPNADEEDLAAMDNESAIMFGPKARPPEPQKIAPPPAPGLPGEQQMDKMLDGGTKEADEGEEETE